MTSRLWTTMMALVSVVGGCVGDPPPPPGNSGTTDAVTNAGTTTGGLASTTDSMTSAGSGSFGSTGSSTSSGLDESTTVSIDPDSTGEPPSNSTGSTGGSSGGVMKDCDSVFGAAPDYLLCASDEMSCTFQVTAGRQSCNVVCAMFGQVCIDAFDNPAMGDLCLVQGNSSCKNDRKNNTICVCSI